MKKFFVFYGQKVILNSANEAEAFINGLTNRNEPDGRRLVVNDNVRRLLARIFADENDGAKMQTTGCSPDCFIYCYPALGETPSACEAAWRKKEEQDRQRKEDEYIRERERKARELNERRAELLAMPSGFYEVTISVTVIDVLARSGLRTKTYRCKADNGLSAYQQTIDSLREAYGDNLMGYEDIVGADISMTTSLL